MRQANSWCTYSCNRESAQVRFADGAFDLNDVVELQQGAIVIRRDVSSLEPHQHAPGCLVQA